MYSSVSSSHSSQTDTEISSVWGPVRTGIMRQVPHIGKKWDLRPRLSHILPQLQGSLRRCIERIISWVLNFFETIEFTIDNHCDATSDLTDICCDTIPTVLMVSSV